MALDATIVFTDLHGSTAVFEKLGNARATEAVTQLTAWIVRVAEQHGGLVIKTLGDGVMLMFRQRQAALTAVVDLQRQHVKAIALQPSVNHLPIRVGIATGSIEIVDSDCFGDAVNVASRLCDLAGPNQIWASANVVVGLKELPGVSYRMLGPISIRGRVEPCAVHQIEWREEESTDFVTMQASLPVDSHLGQIDALGCELQISCGDQKRLFRAFDLPAHIGRIKTMDFVVSDPRVSRTHARLEWRNGSVVFIDTSSYGSWVRFNGATGPDILLRRNECVLHNQGEICLGANFADVNAPRLLFEVRMPQWR